MGADDALHVGEGVDLASVDRHDQVARLEPGGFRGARGLHRFDSGRCRLFAVQSEHRREDDDRQDEVGNRSCRNDRGALRHRLEEEADPSFLFSHLIDGGGVRDARGILVAEEFHITPERDRRDLPARSMAIVEAEQLRTQSDREGQHAHTAPARDEKMTEFVKEDDDGEDKQEGDDIAGKPAAPGREISKE